MSQPKKPANANVPFAEQGSAADTPFSALALEFARFLARQYGACAPVQLAGALVIEALDNGSTCIDLASDHFRQLALAADMPELPRAEIWLPLLRESPAVATSVSQRRPLVLEGSVLSLYRYRQLELWLESFFKAAMQFNSESIPDELTSKARALFAHSGSLSRKLPGGDLQCAGAFLPFFFRVSVITGGPGTGKTTVLARMLLLLCESARLEGRELPRIVLAAPTGKAAQRMSESLRRALESETVKNVFAPEIIEHIAQIRPLTIHRLLGIAPGKGARKNADDRLECDIAVLDECSMVDILLMKAIAESLNDKAKLVLLGDRNQLPSIGAGRVLGDLCRWQKSNCFSSRFADSVNTAIENPANHIASDGNTLCAAVELVHSYRFDSSQSIGIVAGAVNSGDSERALAVLEQPQMQGELSTCALLANPGRVTLLDTLSKLYSTLLAAADPDAALAALDKGMVLTGHNDGVYGRLALNDALCNRFADRLVTPIMVTVNDPRRNLSNGDIGVLFGRGTAQKGFFAHLDEPLLRFDLPAYETAFAITIHKSQGSEFDEILMVLPGASKLLSRELLYTAITRARRNCTIFADRETLRSAINRRSDRDSGLFKTGSPVTDQASLVPMEL